MKVDLNQSIAGQSLRSIRDLFRRHERYPVDATAAFLKISEQEAANLLQELVKAGFLARDDGASEHWKEPIYETTPLGTQLRNASALKRIQRTEADQIVGKLLRRAGEINRDQQYIYCVEQICAFGSYITDSPDLGDIDVAVGLELRHRYEGSIVEANLARADASGRRLSYIQRLCYGEREVRQLLRRVSRRVSIHDIRELDLLKAENRLLYKHHQMDVC